MLNHERANLYQLKMGGVKYRVDPEDRGQIEADSYRTDDLRNLKSTHKARLQLTAGKP